MAFTKAVKQVKFAKISLQGKEKSGKTTTAAMLAIDTALKYHPGKPVAFLSSEPGVDYVLDMFAAEKVEVIADRRSDFIALRQAIPDAVKAGAGILLIDSASTYWRELVSAFKKENKIKKLLPFHYTPIKQTWSEFTDQFVPAKLDIFVCGRLGFEFEELENEEGETETRRVGTKMKTEGDFNYETDLIVELEKRDDLDTANAETIQMGKKRRLRRTFQARTVHVATVKGSRVWALNGQSFQFKPEAAYRVGMSAVVGKCFAPYFEFLKKSSDATGDVVTVGNSQELFADEGSENWQRKQRRQTVACEEIKGALSCVFTADTGRDAATKKEVINALFETHSWTAVERMDPDALEYGARVCRRMKDLALTKMPQNRDELLALVEQAKAEIHDEQANGSLNGCAAAAQAAPVNDETIPF